MKLTAALLSLLLLTAPLFAASTSSLSPGTTNNNDSCDISLQPAATLLLPYFEVDFNSPPALARTTLFTVQNVSPLPQIAHVVMWTDFGFPVMNFNIFLTGYDVQSINLYDVLARGVIAPGDASFTTGGTVNTVAVPTNIPPGTQPAGNNANPHFLPSAAMTCASIQGGVMSQTLMADVRSVLTIGRSQGFVTGTCGSSSVGGTHANALGYLTIDVVATCTHNMPTADYFNNELLFDNVLVGDYMDVNPNSLTGNYAGGNPMVHIRAVPSGGNAGELKATNLPYTFYDRYTTGSRSRTFDRRQPLPSAFAPRWIQGGTGSFNTNYKIWREGGTSYPTPCGNYAAINSNMGTIDLVRFDEHENARASISAFCWGPCPPGQLGLPVAASVAASSIYFPPLSTSGDVGGWMYMNLSNGGGTTAYSTGGGPGAARPGFNGPGTSTTNGYVRQSQNWVIVSMSAEGRFAVDLDAFALGNGCSVSPPAGAQIAPAAESTP